MNNLFNALPSIADLQIETKEWLACLKIILSTDNKTPAEFQTALEKESYADLKNHLSKEHLLAVIEYLDAWQKMVPLVMTWYSILGMAWYRTTGRDLEADDLVSLIIEFLPDEIEQLESLRDKFDIACQINQMNDVGCIMMQFHLAVCAKILFIKNKPAEVSMEYTEKIQLVANTIREESAYNQLCFVCIQYENHLKQKMASQIDQLHYHGHKLNRNKEKNTPDNILTEIQQGACGLLVDDKETIYLLHKYLLVSNIKKTLFQQKKLAAQCLIEFEKKFHLYIDIQQENKEFFRIKWRLGNRYFNALDIKSMFIFHSVEQKFIGVADSMSNSLNTDDEKKLAELHSTFDDYEKHLETKIKATLENAFYYKKGGLYENTVFGEIINDIQINAESILFFNKEILLLINKYLIILDMKHSLFRKNIVEFSAKFSHHFPYLNQKIAASETEKSSIGNIFYLSRFSYLFPFRSEETVEAERQFVETGDLVIGGVNNKCFNHNQKNAKD